MTVLSRGDRIGYMSDTQTIKDKIDIVQLIQEYVPLKKSGINWKGCCPFHQEKTPSFMVHPERQFFHCFGCSKSGDIFSFIQEIEGLEFPESLKLLADRAGVKLTSTFRSEVNKSAKNRIYEINSKAVYFFNKFLIEMDVAKGARKYLSDRGLNEDTLSLWQIGYAPDQWDLLLKYLLKKGFGVEDIVLSGLAIKKDGANAISGKGYYDRFRGRIMFPIWDIHGNVVGFTGRILVEGEHTGGKYINTPQTLVYDKSRVIFGLDKARMEIRKKDRIVLVEGQMDVIACFQAGMKNVVASSGTALTEDQVRILKRYSSNIHMAFDMDDAGIKAAKRGIDICLEQGMNIKIIQIPTGSGKDADECIKKDKKVWFEAVENAKEVMEWYFDINLNNLDLSNPKAKQVAAENILIEISRLPYAIERDHWLKELSTKISVDISTLKEEMNRVEKINKQVQPKIKEESTEQKNDFIKKDRYELDIENLWAIFFKSPDLYKKYFDRVKAEYFNDSYLQAIYEIVKKQYNVNKEFSYEKLEKSCDDDLRKKVNILLLQADKYFNGVGESDLNQEINSILTRVEGEYKKKLLFKNINT